MPILPDEREWWVAEGLDEYAMAEELLALRARVAECDRLSDSNRSAYREIKRLRKILSDAGLVAGLGPDSPVFDE